MVVAVFGVESLLVVALNAVCLYLLAVGDWGGGGDGGGGGGGGGGSDNTSSQAAQSSPRAHVSWRDDDLLETAYSHPHPAVSDVALFRVLTFPALTPRAASAILDATLAFVEAERAAGRPGWNAAGHHACVLRSCALVRADVTSVCVCVCVCVRARASVRVCVDVCSVRTHPTHPSHTHDENDNETHSLREPPASLLHCPFFTATYNQ